MVRGVRLLLSSLLIGAAACSAALPESASLTYRGDAQRTASDGRALPPSPRVLWVFKSDDGFVAAPVVADGAVFVSGLSASNVGTFYCLTMDADARERVL